MKQHDPVSKDWKREPREVKSIQLNSHLNLGLLTVLHGLASRPVVGGPKCLSCICDVLAGDLVPVILTLLFGEKKKEILAAECECVRTGGLAVCGLLAAQKVAQTRSRPEDLPEGASDSWG